LLLGCDIPKGFINSNTALHWAVYNKWLDVSVWLIERGAKVDSRNGMGETPLHLACHTRFDRGIEMLLFHGSDPAVVFTTIPSDSPT
jgi:ankyrin repeat protein